MTVEEAVGDGIETIEVATVGSRMGEKGPPDEEDEVMLILRGAKFWGNATCCWWGKDVKSVLANIFGSKCMLRGMFKFNAMLSTVGSNFMFEGWKVGCSLSQRFENWDQSGGLSAWDEEESVEEGGEGSLRRDKWSKTVGSAMEGMSNCSSWRIEAIL
jgi:hypothetical protein